MADPKTYVKIKKTYNTPNNPEKGEQIRRIYMT